MKQSCNIYLSINDSKFSSIPLTVLYISHVSSPLITQYESLKCRVNGLGTVKFFLPMCGFIGGGGTGGPDPPKNHKNIGFLCNTGPDPLKTTKLPSQHSMSGHHRPASETPFKWRFAGGQTMAQLQWYLDPLSPQQQQQQQQQ